MRRILPIAMPIVLVLAAAVFVAEKPPLGKHSMVVWADEGRGCSLGRVSGNYGFTLAGDLVLPTGNVPVAGSGLVTIGADGSFSGVETRSVGGGVAQETLGGNVTVNSDCTGILTAPVYESGQLVRTSIFALVFDNNGNDFRAIQTSLVLPDGTSLPNVITVSGTKIRFYIGD